MKKAKIRNTDALMLDLWRKRAMTAEAEVERLHNLISIYKALGSLQYSDNYHPPATVDYTERKNHA